MGHTIVPSEPEGMATHDNSYTYYVEVVNCSTTIDPIGVQVTYTTP
jgi:hypothetical protein